MTHEWVRLEGDIATIGISDHAQSEMGDIVFVDLPQVGRALAAEETFGSLESVKTASDLYAPVGGEIVETNAAAVAQTDLVNTDPYGAGWLVKLKVADPGQVAELMDAEAYKATL